MIAELLMSTVLYVPGWMRTQHPQAGVLESLSNTFASASVEFMRWDGDNVVWPMALDAADRESWRLAFEVATMPPEARAGLTVVGHSLGARMTVRMLARLAEKGLKVRQAFLLAAAIPYDDPDLAKMGLASELPIVAVCNPDDVTLRYVYGLAGGEGRAAFGANGTVSPVPNVKEYVTPTNITRQVAIDRSWAKHQVLKDIANHHVAFYLEYMRRVLGGEGDSGEVMVPQDMPTVEWPVMDSGVWWDVVEEASGWKLERNKVTGHFRIIDPKKKRTAWGREREMRASFDKVKLQLGK